MSVEETVEAPAIDQGSTGRRGRLVHFAGPYLALTKPRIMLLLLFTGWCGMMVAAHRIPGWRATIATMLGLALSTGGSAALNMWYDRDIDSVMKRTMNRPLPLGLVDPSRAFWFGLSLVALAYGELGLLVNWITAWLAAFGAVYYVLVYTVWLKRRTPQNIVIGGGAGALPPVIGWTAVTGHLALAPLLMFLVVFLWTPPHFWSLALFRNEDYKKAGIPMLPAVRGERSAKRQSVLYGLLLLGSSVWLGVAAGLGSGYMTVAVLLGCGFLYCLARMWMEPEGTFRWARKSFFFSLIYLSVIFVAMAAFAA